MLISPCPLRPSTDIILSIHSQWSMLLCRADQKFSSEKRTKTIFRRKQSNKQTNNIAVGAQYVPRFTEFYSKMISMRQLLHVWPEVLVGDVFGNLLLLDHEQLLFLIRTQESADHRPCCCTWAKHVNLHSFMISIRITELFHPRTQKDKATVWLQSCQTKQPALITPIAHRQSCFYRPNYHYLIILFVNLVRAISGYFKKNTALWLKSVL